MQVKSVVILKTNASRSKPIESENEQERKRKSVLEATKRDIVPSRWTDKDEGRLCSRTRFGKGGELKNKAKKKKKGSVRYAVKL